MTELTQKITKQKFVKILGSTRSGGSISFASKAVGFSRQTIASWRRSDSQFDKAVSEATILGKVILADKQKAHW
jgi:molybdenum-dependent DNA-binding transcriptional regulator ModE